MKHIFHKSILLLSLLLFFFYAKAEKISSFDWTDKTIITTSGSYSTQNLSNLTDNDANTVFQDNAFSSGTWIKFEMPESFKITGYTLSASTVAGNSPKAWIIEGSTDGNIWSSIDSRSNISFAQARQTNSYQLSFPTDRETISSYKHIRITFSESNGVQNIELSELQIFGFPTQLLTNITGNGGVVSGQHTGYTGEGVENLINNLISKKYCVVGQSAGWVEYLSPTEILITAYSLTSCVANVERDPKAWQLLGYNESASSWDVIDTQTNHDFMMRFSTMEYPVQTTKSYSRFRLNITQNNGEDNFQFCKWQLFGTETSAPKLKVACVGNSITENSALADSQKYPSLLQSYLGDDYQVRNYGLSGRTLLKKGNLPYWNESKYTEVKNWNPDIVVIKLGTNDAKASNWQYKNEFVNNYVDFINSFKNLSNNPTIYICKPLPAYTNTMNIDGTVIRDEIMPMIEQIAQLTGVEIIDLYTPLEGKESYLYDAVHPNVKGTTIMAHVVCNAIDPTHLIPTDLYSQVNSFDWTDKAVSITSSGMFAQNELNKLIDNDLSTVFAGGTFAADTWIQVELPELFKLTGYAISAGNTPANVPKSWTIQGSTDGNTWTNIDIRSNVAYLRQSETNLFETTLPSNRETIPSYKFIRFNISANSGGADLELSEWQIFGFPAQLFTGITGNGGVITGQYAGYNENGYVETVDKLIDNTISTKYCVVGQNAGWIEYSSPTKVKLTAYSLTRCGALYERDPKAWTLQAYDNETQSWTTLDTQTNQDFMAQFNTMEYQVQTDNSYSKFRLNITEIQGTSTFQFAKWRLIGEETSAPLVKVACIGNSITANARLDKVAPEERYPAILQSLLGDEYLVENLGVGGATLLKGSSYPYWNQSAYTTALSFKPDIIVIKLGTNDSNPSNWIKKANFVSDYVEFINSFKAVNPTVQVFVCYPIASWHSTMPIVEKTVADEIIPMIQQVASQTGATIIDLHTQSEGKVYQTYDYVHPDVRGTTLIANTVYKAIKPDGQEPYMNPAYISNLDFFDRTDYVVNSSSSTNVDVSDLFDNDLSTGVNFGTLTANASFQFELPEDFRATGYSITTGTADASNAPKTWIFQGSTDGTTWSDIDTRSNQLFQFPKETSMYQVYIPDHSSANAALLPSFKYFRMLFSENNGGTGLNLSEFQLYGMNKTMVTSVTGNGGVITSQYAGYQGGGLVETVDKLINNNIAEKYCATGQKNGWVQYESSKPILLKSYSVSSALNLIERTLKAWELLGSNDGVNWDVLDSQSNQNFFMELNTFEYEVNSNTTYKFFRLNILENNGANEFQFAKWQLFEKSPTKISETFFDNNIKLISTGGKLKLTCENKVNYSIFNLTGVLQASGTCEAGTHNIFSGSEKLYIVKINNRSMKVML